jgi:hypothetical protein
LPVKHVMELLDEAYGSS